MIDVPPVAFSEWAPWSERVHLSKELPLMGVYLWGYFPSGSRPKVPAFPELPQDVIYIGETNDLDARLLGPTGARHQRLKQYVQAYPQDTRYACLHVSVFRVAPFQPRNNTAMLSARTRGT